MPFTTPTPTLTPSEIIAELHNVPAVKRAFAFFEENTRQISEDHIRLCSVPAPPFGEAERARYLCQEFLAAGLKEVCLDDEGNATGFRPGHAQSPLLAVTAHLDTVFPAGTDFSVRRSGHRLMAPGVSDDGCGLAALIALSHALRASEISTRGSLLFVGTVGEEGEGNLRGVRHLLTQGQWANRIDAFISLDGSGVERITNGALGSRRYRVRLAGRGGHSWGDFGAANPVHALGRAIARLVTYPAPRDPRTTFNVGRIEGGGSVNVIAREAMMDVDLRSVSTDELRRLDAFFRRAVYEAVEDENNNRRRGDRALETELQLIGDRPSGETAADASIVMLGAEATRSIGFEPQLDRASTDSNIPISLGIPAITIGAGGASGDSHTVDEWYDPRGRDLGLKRLLLLSLALVGCEKS